MWNEIKELIQKWGENPLVLLLIGSTLPFIFRLLWAHLGRFTSWVWAKMSRRGADRAFEKMYLDWLIDQHRHLGLLPAQVVARRWGERQKFVGLEQIYVRLSISSQGGDERWAETYGDGTSCWRKPPSLGLRFFRYMARLLPLPDEWYDNYSLLREASYKSGAIGLLIDRHERLVVRGDPGSGKTTLLRYLALTCARTLRHNKQDGDSSRLVKQRLLWDERPFPILVRLSRHGEVASWAEGRDLLDTFSEEMPHELRERCPASFFERRLESGNCFILLDSFDELGNTDARHAMARRVAGFLALYGRPENRIVVTTRIIGYEGQLDQYGFTIRTVQTLNTGEVRALIKQRYKAIAFAESAGRQEAEERAIKRRLRQRAEMLIAKIEETLRLRQLATNPMLLSLIVLVHFLKVELPEERVLLYRDCVEILTERWQRVKREELGLKKSRQELTMNQKLVLLRDMAFAMQQGRQAAGSQALIAKERAQEIIAHKLPDFLSLDVPDSENARQEVYRQRAEAWLGSIQVESGILVERGLDQRGDPLISFSHLTFQEYLAAVALDEMPAYQSLLWPNLLNPAWREVVLLYAVLSNDATPLIETLLATQPDGLLLAGYCLAERLKRVDAALQQQTMNQLKTLFSQGQADQASQVANVLQAIGGHDVMAFMRRQINDHSPLRRLAAVRALRWTAENDPQLDDIRTALLQTLQSANELDLTVAARESLAQIGDPRFIGPEPIMLPIPRHTLAELTSWAAIKELLTPPGWEEAANFRQRLALVGRSLDYLLFILWRVISRRTRIIRLDAFEMSKYPITNLEYSRFIDATGHQAPTTWIEDAFPSEEATHPVAGVSPKDADAYCKWLSQQTGKTYRLPTEWEWEMAASGGQKSRKYPWGEQFDPNKCNTEEAGIEGTTPVGSYRESESLYGVSDMSGNVLGITTGLFIYNSLLLPILLLSLLLSLLPLILSSSLLSSSLLSLLSLSILLPLLPPLLLPLLLLILLLILLPLSYNNISYNIIMRGGAWNTQANQSTGFYRKELLSGERTTHGFRCVREL